jgi:hypothetical protein
LAEFYSARNSLPCSNASLRSALTNTLRLSMLHAVRAPRNLKADDLIAEKVLELCKKFDLLLLLSYDMTDFEFWSYQHIRRDAAIRRV